ncbi:MAG: alcohol dehydrogenase catalytic domain-containing protein [Chloroflexota bacterium]
MRSVLFHGPGRVELIDRPSQPLAAGEVRIKVDRSGICGSDVATWRGDWATPNLPVVKGHEVCGTVTETGSGVDRVRVGQLVAVRPIGPCGDAACKHCGAGHYSLCKQFTMLGNTGSGGWAEEMVMAQAHARPIPAGVPVDEAAFAEPIAVVCHAFNLAGSLQGARVAVLGAGILGLVAIQVARARGASAVYATGRQDGKLALARDLGADAVGDSRSQDVVRAGLDQGGPYDVVIDLIGSSEALDQGIHLSAPSARIILVAGPHEKRLSFDYVAHREREVAVISSRIYGEDFDDALEILGRRAVKTDRLITHRVALADVESALHEAVRNRSGVIKMLIQPNG